MTTSSHSLIATRFEQHAQEVYAWAYRLLGQHHDALDVVQDVFLRWNSQCESEMPTAPRGWLRRVTVNRAVDVIRGRRKTVDSAIAEAVLESGDGAADRTIDAETLRSDVAIALDKLTEIQRAVLVAKVYDELTFARIATEHEVSVSTVKTHYLRAVRSVRDQLRRWDNHDGYYERENGDL